MIKRCNAWRKNLTSMFKMSNCSTMRLRFTGGKYLYIQNKFINSSCDEITKRSLNLPR